MRRIAREEHAVCRRRRTRRTRRRRRGRRSRQEQLLLPRAWKYMASVGG